MTGLKRSSWAWVGVIGLIGGQLSAYEFNADSSCVLLNENNTDILTAPAACNDPFNPLPANWCNCTRTILTNPKAGEATGIEQGTIWVRGQPGIGNHRVEVSAGTLDLSGIDPGDEIGETLINELVPQALGVPPGTFFMVRSVVRATSNDGTCVEFDVALVELSPVVPAILRYDPLNAAHSDGILYRGRLTSHGPGNGFTWEYRYEGKPGMSPAIQPGDAGSPGFNVRYSLSIIPAEPARYVLPDADAIVVRSTLRKFKDSGSLVVANPDEILPLGDPEICRVVVEPEPCREFEDLISIRAVPNNHQPTAEIVVTDARTLAILPEPIRVFIDCGEGRAILRGSNSTDGDGGSQGLTYKWEVIEGEAGGAVIPPETAAFKDVEVAFLIPGKYRIRLTVNDGQLVNNTASAEVEIFTDEGFGPNLPPEVTVRTEPDPPVVSLAGGTARVKLNAIAFTGADGCPQTLTYLWERVSGPASLVFDKTNDDDTTLTLTEPGEYVVRVTVDDGAPEDSTTVVDTTVQVAARFQRCDSNGDGANDLSDAVHILSFLFQGGPAADCRAAMNCNSDTAVDISDAVFDLSFLFLGAEGPPPPYPSCDSAPADCSTSTACAP